MGCRVSRARAFRPVAPRRRPRRPRTRRRRRSWAPRTLCHTRRRTPSLTLGQIPDSFKTPSMAGGPCVGENPGIPLEGDHPCVQPRSTAHDSTLLPASRLCWRQSLVLPRPPSRKISRAAAIGWPPGPSARNGLPAPLAIDGQTLRQVVHVSLGGKTVRVRLSNAYGTSALVIGAAHVALSAGNGAIVDGTDRRPDVRRITHDRDSRRGARRERSGRARRARSRRRGREPLSAGRRRGGDRSTRPRCTPPTSRPRRLHRRGHDRRHAPRSPTTSCRGWKSWPPSGRERSWRWAIRSPTDSDRRWT